MRYERFAVVNVKEKDKEFYHLTQCPGTGGYAIRLYRNGTVTLLHRGTINDREYSNYRQVRGAPYHRITDITFWCNFYNNLRKGGSAARFT